MFFTQIAIEYVDGKTNERRNGWIEEIEKIAENRFCITDLLEGGTVYGLGHYIIIALLFKTHRTRRIPDS